MSAKQKRIHYVQVIYLISHAFSIGLGVNTFEKKTWCLLHFFDYLSMLFECPPEYLFKQVHVNECYKRFS